MKILYELNDFNKNGLVGGCGRSDCCLGGHTSPLPSSDICLCPCNIGEYEVVSWGKRRGQGLVPMGGGERIGEY